MRSCYKIKYLDYADVRKSSHSRRLKKAEKSSQNLQKTSILTITYTISERRRKNANLTFFLVQRPMGIYFDENNRDTSAEIL